MELDAPGGGLAMQADALISCHVELVATDWAVVPAAQSVRGVLSEVRSNG